MKKILLVLIATIASITTLKASHIVGARLSYEWVSGNGYLIHLTEYRDCQGISFGTTANVTAYSSSTSQVLNLTLSMVGVPVNVTPICSGSASQISCNGGNYPGWQRADYQGTVTLSAAADWIIYFEDCCRSGAITNLSNASADVMHVRATLNNLNGPNNSPVFTQNPTFLIPNTMLSQLNYHSTDIDGDSLSYSLVGAMGTSGAALAYNLPYSGTSPMQSTTGNVLDANTGVFSVTPSAMQMAVVCVKVSEYRNGNLVGTTYTDCLVNSVNMPNNALPSLSGMNGGFLMSTSVCANQTVSFYLTSNDANAGDSTFISYDGTISGASYYVNNAQHATGTFTWTPTAADVRPYPYIVSFTVRDNACSYYGTQTYAYTIYVNQCAVDSVWPGDANADYADNMYDILSIGVAYGDQGPSRTNASNNWVAQACTDWTNNFPSGINHKHADCNGDGIVNSSDTAAVIANFGSTHVRMGGSEGVGGLILYADMPSTFYGYDYQAIPIKLDNVGSGIDKIYGLSFSISWPTGYMDNASTAVTTYNTLFANMAPDVIVANQSNIAGGFADLAEVKTDHLQITPQGIVAYFDFTLLPNTSVNYLSPNITNVHAIDSLGNDLPISPLQNSSNITWSGIDEVNSIHNVMVYPNPANDLLMIKGTCTNDVSIQVQDMLGRTISIQSANSTQLKNGININTKNLANGFYNLTIKSSNDIVTEKINVTH